MKRAHRLVWLLAGWLPRAVFGAEPTVVAVWPGPTPADTGVSGEEKSRIHDARIVGPTRLVTNVTRPTISVYAAPAGFNTGTAMLIFPGGGYWDLFWELEGEEIAAWLNSIGVTGIILKYRVPRRAEDVKGEPAAGPLLDAQRAVSLVRSRAKAWGIDPRRIGVVGFSAGGHLAMATALQFEQRAYAKIDAVDDVSCRPDFAISCYPGYLMTKERDGIRREWRIPKNTPPVLLVHASDDSISPAENSAVMYLALKRAGVPAELHIYAVGEHDFGVRQNGRPPATWPQLCVHWLRSLDLLPRVK